MSEPLFTVQETFIIHGRGHVLVGLTTDRYQLVKSGDELTLEFPDGSGTTATVCGVEYPPSIKWVGEKPADPRYGVLVDCEGVPVGTKVYLQSRSPSCEEARSNPIQGGLPLENHAMTTSSKRNDTSGRAQSMSEPFFTVQETFVIPGRGLVLIGFTADRYHWVKSGDLLALELPTGSTVQATARGIEHVTKLVDGRPRVTDYGLLVDCHDVPAGTNVHVLSDPR